jgi:hypothetical protein
MNGKPSSSANRRLIVRASCVAVYFVLLAVLFVNGKGHDILIDNRDSPDGAHLALDFVAVSVNGGESLEYYPGDRDRASVKGQKHRVVLELEDGSKVEKNIRALGRTWFLLSVPMLVAGVDGAVMPSRPGTRLPADDAGGNVNEFTAPMGPGEPGSDPTGSRGAARELKVSAPANPPPASLPAVFYPLYILLDYIVIL